MTCVPKQPPWAHACHHAERAWLTAAELSSALQAALATADFVALPFLTSTAGVSVARGQCSLACLCVWHSRMAR